MQPSHLNYIRLRNKHILSVLRVEAHNSHRTIFMKELSFAHLAAARRNVSSWLGSKVTQTPKLKGKIWKQGPWKAGYGSDTNISYPVHL